MNWHNVAVMWIIFAAVGFSSAMAWLEVNAQDARPVKQPIIVAVVLLIIELTLGTLLAGGVL